MQKCVRTLDIDEVGKTTRHGSFFQMAGNFSFGDYFKAGAIDLAWELLLKPQSDGGYGLPERDLWVTVYEDDDEAEALWLAKGVSKSRIQRLGMSDNYWHMGVPGPCGPDSEIFLDRGAAYGPDGGPAVGGDRFLELWNLVFMQFERGEGSGYDFPILAPLPKQNIDTGMGMERMAAVLQGVDNLYEIDTSRAILDRAAELTGARYGADHGADVRLRVVADHVRTAVMLIGDGVRPANEGRGYVLRRIVRRAVRAMRLLGAHEPVIAPLVDATIGAMGPQYPELVTDSGRIHTVAGAEEGAFLETLRTGAQVFDTAVPAARAGRRRAVRRAGVRAARHVRLPDRPDPGDGRRAGAAGRRGRASGRSCSSSASGPRPTTRPRRPAAPTRPPSASCSTWPARSTFTGYGEVVTDAVLRGLLVDGEVAQAAPEGASVQVVLDRTPFYAEAGGQLADTGRLVLADGTELEVSDVQKALPDLWVHTARVVRGEARTGPAGLRRGRRRAPAQRLAGAHRDPPGAQGAARRAGGVGDPGRLAQRPRPLPLRLRVPGRRPGQRAGRRRAADQRGGAGRPRGPRVRHEPGRGPPDRRDGAVRREVRRRGPGRRGRRLRPRAVRRHARRALRPARHGQAARRGLDRLRHPPGRGAGRAGRLRPPRAGARPAGAARRGVQGAGRRGARTGSRRPSPSCARSRRSWPSSRPARCCSARASSPRRRSDVFGFAYVGVEAPAGTSGDLVRSLALDIRGRIDRDRPAAVVVAAGGDRVSLVATVNEAGRARGLSASALLREAAPAVGGKGGGKDDVAQGGGGNAAGIPEALRLAEYLVGRVAHELMAGPAGVVLAVDVGTVRVGVAASDPHRVLASPVETVPAPGLARVAELAAEREAVLVVVGLPTSLSGRVAVGVGRHGRGPSRPRSAPLVAPVPVELVDERLTTVAATAALRASGRKGKQARAVVDQAAAVALLQGVLDRR